MMMKQGFDHFDGIVYINLDKRKDRKRMLEREFQKIGIDSHKVFRISGYDDELNGVRGCVYSHILALDFSLEKKWNNVLVLEDDCLFVKNQKRIHSYIDTFFGYFQENWDVFF